MPTAALLAGSRLQSGYSTRLECVWVPALAEVESDCVHGWPADAAHETLLAPPLADSVDL